MRRFLFLALIVPGIAPSASEMTHTAYAWFCPSERQAHGTCKTSHSACGIDCRSLRFSCKLKRDENTKDRDERTFDDLASTGTFHSYELNAKLVNAGRASYCTYNRSKYKNLVGRSVLGQKSAQYCRDYRASDSPGGGDEP